MVGRREDPPCRGFSCVPETSCEATRCYTRTASVDTFDQIVLWIRRANQNRNGRALPEHTLDHVVVRPPRLVAQWRESECVAQALDERRLARTASADQHVEAFDWPSASREPVRDRAANRFFQEFPSAGVTGFGFTRAPSAPPAWPAVCCSFGIGAPEMVEALGRRA